MGTTSTRSPPRSTSSQPSPSTWTSSTSSCTFSGLLVRQGRTKEAQRGEEKNSKSQLCKIYLLFVRIILPLCRYRYIHYVTCPIKPFQYLVLRPMVDQMSPNVDILLTTELISHSFK